jgi:hypothetical protein
MVFLSSYRAFRSLGVVSRFQGMRVSNVGTYEVLVGEISPYLVSDGPLILLQSLSLFMSEYLFI